MKALFDDVAGRFASDIDRVIETGRYVRGDLFVALAKREFKAGAQVLDYGCGPGRLSLLLAQQGFAVHGVDTSDGMVEQARRIVRPGLTMDFATIQQADEALPAQAYDAIVCSSVIEYVPDASTLLQGFHRALRADGRLLISYANASSHYRQQWMKQHSAGNPMAPSQQHVWTWPEFSALLGRNGFAAVTRPRYYESPADRPVLGPLLRRLALFGSLGVVAARKA